MLKTFGVKKILFLNLPHFTKVQRRYMCSFNTPNMLFPPIEMLYLASIAREWHRIEVLLLDSIAENYSLKQVKANITSIKPDMIVCLTGFEIYEEDVKVVKELKNNFSDILFVLFGHYPTIFPKETLKYSKADFILKGEPDINFSNLIGFLNNKLSIGEMEGVFYKDASEKVCINEGQDRIKNTKVLPLPAHDLLKISLYNEPFLPKPMGLIQSARGCPYSCNFCVRSYGTRLALRSPESIIEEIKLLLDIHKIKSLRFIDDTFTATSKRVIRFCQLLIESGIKIKWSCLSRADTLTEEMISWMQKAGCVRIYIGIETGSPKIQKLIDKQIDLEQGIENTKLLKKYGIETTAFFMVGYPDESDEDFQMSVDYALKSNFDYVIPGQFIAYPGTMYFNLHKDNIDFNLFPYKNMFKNKEIVEMGLKREKEFYKSYYFRAGYFNKFWKRFIKNPNETIVNTLKAIRFQLIPKEKSIRNDYF